jgi:uncharacterized repeat protein (TIGR01451 family)/LPXTG-motif cell wall-anchored protein
MNLFRRFVIAAFAAGLGLFGLPVPASAAAAWQLTVTRVDPSPQQSGGTMRFRIQAQCSAVDVADCRDSEISWPAQLPTTFSLPVPHPAIESFGLDAATNRWVVNLQDSLSVGTSIEFDIIATAPNSTTPDGTPVRIDATLTASNTPNAVASAAGAWSATANLGVEKYLEFGPDTDALLDVPVRYYIYPCDPSWNGGASNGHLYVEGVTITDTLPADVVVNSVAPGGVVNAADHTVTWTPSGMLENQSCEFEGPSDYWIDVTFPSSKYGPTSGPPAVIEATNNVTVTGYPLGKANDASAMMTDTDSLLHGFSLPNPVGSHTKKAATPYFSQNPITFEGDRADFGIYIRTAAAGTSPYFFRITDPLPCLDYTPNAATQYESHTLGGTACAEPAYQPDIDISIELDPTLLSVGDSTAFAAAHPTIPLHVRTTTGADVIVDVPYAGLTGFGMMQYLITGPALTAALGGAGASDLVVDSRDFGLQVKVTPYDGQIAARLYLRGNIAHDTAAHPMLDQYRVRNYGHFDMFFGTESRYVGAIQDSVIVTNRSPVLSVTKTVDPTTGLVMIDTQSWGTPLREGESLIVTDLLPLGYKFSALSQTFLGYGVGLWSWLPGSGYFSGPRNTTGYPELSVDIRSYLNIEVIDDFNGTGRQLVRVRFPEPPTADGWSGMSPLTRARVSFDVTPGPMTLAATNRAEAFPSDPVSAARLQCQSGIFAAPTAANSNDTNDLDADGLVSGDAYCEAVADVVPASSVVNVASDKAVKGENDPSFMHFPAIGSIDSNGGTADFQINLSNVGGVALSDLVVYDVLPFVGDTGLSQTQVATARGSAWATRFAGIDPATVPAGAQIEYSGSTNPCRDELTTPAATFPAGCVNDWSTSFPSGDIALVKALRVTFPSGTLSSFDPGESISIEYAVTYPSGVAPGEVAWNNFAFAGDRVDTGSAILPTEPPKVGLAIPQIDLAVTKSAAPSPLLVNRPATYTVSIDHQGSVSPTGEYTMPAGTAHDVELVDDLGGGALSLVSGSSVIVNTRTGVSEGATFDESTGAISIPVFGPNDTYVLTYQATLANAGSVTNTVEVTGHPGATDVDSTPDNGDLTEDDLAKANVSWVDPAIHLDKLVESSPGSGTFIEADSTDGLKGIAQPYKPVAYRFVVTNPTSVAISNVALEDALIGFSCNRAIGTLAANASVTIDCTWPFGFAPGERVNTASVSGTVTLSGSTVTVSDTDKATITVSKPVDLSLTKEVDPLSNGQWSDSGTARYGTDFTYRLTVSNASGAGDATGVKVAEQLPAGVSIVSAPSAFSIATGIWTVGDLAAGESTSIELVARIVDLAAFRAGTKVNAAEISAANEPDIDSSPGNGTTTEDDRDTASIDVATFAVGNQVFLDVNGNGVRDSLEPGIGGVTLHLLSTSGAVLATTETDSNGFYVFDDLPAGSYRVSIDDAEFATGATLAGMLSPSQDEADPNDNVDGNDNGVVSGVSVTSGLITVGTNEPTGEAPTSVTNAPDNQANLTVDFGFFLPGAIGDWVWRDLDGDGVQTPGEPGVDGVKVSLFDADGHLVGTATTSGGGRYEFTGLIPGDYRVRFDLTTLPLDSLATTAHAGDAALDSDGDIETGWTRLTTIESGEVDHTIDLGVRTAHSALELTKAAVGNAVAGSNVDWRITLTNSGPDPVSGSVALVDELPAGLAYVSTHDATDGLECSYSATTATLRCTSADGLDVGATLSVLVTTTVSATAGGTVINSARIESAAGVTTPPTATEVKVLAAETVRSTTTTTTTTTSAPAVTVAPTTTLPAAAAPATLSFTGSSSFWTALGGLALVVLGSVGLVLRKRRRSL